MMHGVSELALVIWTVYRKLIQEMEKRNGVAELALVIWTVYCKLIGKYEW